MGRLIKAYAMALRFLFKTVVARSRRIAVENRQWQIHQQHVEVDCYFPKNRAKNRGTILLIHGMNCLGARDPRLMKVCQSFVNLGFICVMPTIQSITEHLILTTQADDIRAIMQHLLQAPDLCPQKRFSVFSASFSGALAILAASDAKVAKHVSAILTIGIYHDGAQTMNDILSNACDDKFARLVGVKNVLRLSGKQDNVIDQALDAAILDEFEYMPNHHVMRYFDSLTMSERDRAEKVLHAIDAREYKLPPAVKKAFDANAFRHGFDFLHCLPNLPFSVFVLHSFQDQIMLVRHVYTYQQWLAKHNLKKQHPVLVTAVLDHADTRLTFKDWVCGVGPLLKLFAGFLRAAQN